MDKNEFLRGLRGFITTWFNDEEFKNNPAIEVRVGTRPLKDFLDFYNPWWYDKDQRPEGKFENALNDPSARATTVAEDAEHPDKWDNSDVPVIIDQLHPVPIATDASIGKTLILDGNKTICRMIFKDKVPLDQKIIVAEIIGPDLQKLNGDLYALHHRSETQK